MQRCRPWLGPIVTGCMCACSSGSSHQASGTAEKDAGTVVFSLPDAAICSDGSVPKDSAPGGPDPLCTAGLPSVSYANNVAPILAQCSGEVCHAPWSFDTTVDKPSTACCDRRWLVAPGQPSASHLIQAVLGVAACVPQMPLDEGSLAQADLDTLIAWVCEGAPNN